MTKKIIQIILIILTFLAALSLRFYLSPRMGHYGDLLLFKEWARSALQFGVTNVYEKTFSPRLLLPNYPPLYLYLLNFLAFIYEKFFSLDWRVLSPSLLVLLKTPAILFDLFTGMLLFFFFKKNSFAKAYLIMLFYLFNPGIIYISSYWGQVDSLHTFFILLSIILLGKKRYTWSWLSLTVACLLKVQSIIFIPLFFFINFKKKSWKNLLFNLCLSSFFAFILILPFIIKGKIIYIFNVFFKSAGFFPYLSHNAYNFWYFLFGEKSLLRDTEKLFGLIPYLYLGLFFFLLAYAFILLLLSQKNSPYHIFLAASFIAFSFFMLPTEMHERYLFPFFALFSLIYFHHMRLNLIYGLLSLTFFVNLITVLPFSGINLPYPFIMSNSSAFINILLFFYFLILIFKLIKEKNYLK